MDVLFCIVLSAALVARIITLLKWAAVEDSEAQALDRIAAELRELVEEQHPVVRERSRMYLEGWRWSRSPVQGPSAHAMTSCERSRTHIWRVQAISKRRPSSAASRSTRSRLRSAHRPETRSSRRLRTARCSTSGPTLAHTDTPRRT